MGDGDGCEEWDDLFSWSSSVIWPYILLCLFQRGLEYRYFLKTLGRFHSLHLHNRRFVLSEGASGLVHTSKALGR